MDSQKASAIVALMVATLVLEPSAAMGDIIFPSPVLITAAVRGGVSDSKINAQDSAAPAIPSSGVLVADPGGSSSITTYDLSDSGFEIRMNHTRADFTGAFAATSARIEFTVDTAVTFEMSGSYAATDADGKNVVLTADLQDTTDSSFVFLSEQRSNFTPNEMFTLGLQEGDDTNSLIGSLAGLLIPGHIYLLRMSAQIAGGFLPSPTSPATAMGTLKFAFVPEPSTALLVALGLAGLSWRGRVRQC